MIAVIFEVRVQDGGGADYLAQAASLRPLLAQSEGFSVERFQSLTDPDKLLSLSFFQDEAAVARWRAQPEHRLAQGLGRSGLFADYRLRVARVIRDYGLTDRDQVPTDQRPTPEPGQADRAAQVG